MGTGIQRLSFLKFLDFPLKIGQNVALLYFIYSERDPEMQKALRLTYIKNIHSTVLYAMEIKAAYQALIQGSTQFYENPHDGFKLSNVETH